MTSKKNTAFQPDPACYNFQEKDHKMWRFIGRFVGKAVYDKQPVGNHFTRSFYKHILGEPINLFDFEDVEIDLFKSYKAMLNTKTDDENDGDGLMIPFVYTDPTVKDKQGNSTMIELIEDGFDEEVCDANKDLFVKKVIEFKCTKQIQSQIDSFKEGFYEVIDQDLIRIFNYNELELLICGVPNIDVADWKKHCDYSGYSKTDKAVGFWWTVIEEFSQEQKAAMLQFVTGSSHVPLGGFKNFKGSEYKRYFKLTKRGGSLNKLPIVHTCYNEIELPPYNTLAMMRKRMICCITYGMGAFLMS